MNIYDNPFSRPYTVEEKVVGNSKTAVIRNIGAKHGKDTCYHMNMCSARSYLRYLEMKRRNIGE